jgi:hypothetical protein
MDAVSRQIACSWVILGTAADQPLAAEIAKGFEGKIEDLTGKTSMEELMARLRTLTALLTNDTGTMHLADWLGIPLVAVFGSTEPSLTGPRSKTSVVLRHQVECSPCFLRECPLDELAVQAVALDQVVDELAHLGSLRVGRRGRALRASLGCTQPQRGETGCQQQPPTRLVAWNADHRWHRALPEGDVDGVRHMGVVSITRGSRVALFTVRSGCHTWTITPNAPPKMTDSAGVRLRRARIPQLLDRFEQRLGLGAGPSTSTNKGRDALGHRCVASKLDCAARVQPPDSCTAGRDRPVFEKQR